MKACPRSSRSSQGLSAPLGGDQNLVLYLDAGGEIVSALGGTGAGPGEFGTLTSTYGTGDRFAVWDPSNRRVSRFASRAREEEFRFDIPFMHRILGMFADGTIVSTLDPGAAAFQHRDHLLPVGEPTSYELWNQDGQQVALLRGSPVLPSPALSLVRRGEPIEAATLLFRGSTCLPELRHVVRDDHILIADSQEGVLLSLNRSGSLTVLFRTPHRGTVTDRAVDGLRAWIESQEFTADSAQAALARTGKPGDPLPSAWGAMVEDRSGGVWLRRAMCYEDDPTEIWEIIGRTGELAATVAIPEGLRVLAVDGDRVLVVATGALGIEQLAVFRIVR